MVNSNFNFRTRKPGAFTLMELLVVISIIALLMAILMPSLNMAREHAVRAVCMSNLKHWGLVLGIYAHENNGRYPPGGVMNWTPQLSDVAIFLTGPVQETEEQMKSLFFYEYSGYPANWSTTGWTWGSVPPYKTTKFWTCPNLAKLNFPEPPYYWAGMIYFNMGYGFTFDGSKSGFPFYGSPYPTHAPSGPSSPSRWNLMHDRIQYDRVVGSVFGVFVSAHQTGGGGFWAFDPDGDGSWGPRSHTKPAGANQLYNDFSVSWVNYDKLEQVSTWGTYDYQ